MQSINILTTRAWVVRLLLTRVPLFVLLQEEWIGHGLHYDIQLFYTRHADVLTAAGITYEDLTHAMGLVGLHGSHHAAIWIAGPDRIVYLTAV